MSSPAKLTDTQRAILFEASERKDRCLIAPKTLKGAENRVTKANCPTRSGPQLLPARARPARL